MAYTTINKPSQYFNTILYTGTGSSNSLTGVGFQPDWVWIKKRNGAVGHRLYDAVRGVQNTLFSQDTAAEATGQTTTLTAFNSDGFTVISESGVNASGDTYVAWNWLGANSTTSNTAGTITSTVSANTTSGFSIVSYTGNGTDNATVGHGLGSSINFVIVKRRNTTSNWLVQGSKVGTGYGQYLELNSTGAISTASDNIKSVSSSTLTLGTNGSCNTLSDTYIAYCFAEVKGFSKFGSYTGNGSTNGTFVYTGFKPAFVMLKSSSSGAVGWITHDNKRIGFNPNNYYVEPNNSNAESADTDKILLLSNGFKLISTSASWNSSGGTYIYMAFAENPFVSSTFIPTTAR